MCSDPHISEVGLCAREFMGVVQGARVWSPRPDPGTTRRGTGGELKSTQLAELVKEWRCRVGQGVAPGRQEEKTFVSTLEVANHRGSDASFGFRE